MTVGGMGSGAGGEKRTSQLTMSVWEWLADVISTWTRSVRTATQTLTPPLQYPRLPHNCSILLTSSSHPTMPSCRITNHTPHTLNISLKQVSALHFENQVQPGMTVKFRVKITFFLSSPSWNYSSQLTSFLIPGIDNNPNSPEKSGSQ